MFGLMFVSGLLSSMSAWADKLSDVRISLNDIYMALLMSVWMVFLMAAWDRDSKMASVGLIGILIVFFLIRRQVFVTPRQYALGMIPHHSMAVLMSKRVLERPVDPRLQALASSIIQSQEDEIDVLKRLAAGK